MDTAQSKSSLLLVDGDPKSLRVLDVSLKKAGFEVSTASSGQEALSALETGMPDLIISDTDLAEMDGFELCSRIKARPEWSKIPFIFVSGRKSIEDKIRGLELGVDDYLTKPIYIKEIGIRVRTALQRAERERMESRRDGRTRFAGDLADVGVVDLVQTIELNRKSGIIHIVNRDNRRGSIFFRDGKVIDAEVGRLSGANALYRLFSWSEGQFAVEFKQIRRHDVIDVPMAALLMEGMRRLDESTRLLEGFPSSNGVLEVDCRVLAEELAELPDEMNSVLRLCDGARTVQEVVEDCDHPDLEALTIIDKLYREQIIFAREAPDRSGESEPGERLARWLSEGEDEDGAAAEETGTSSESAAPSSFAQDGDLLPTSTPAPTPAERPADQCDPPSPSLQPALGAPALPLDHDLSGEETLAAALPAGSDSPAASSNEFLPSVGTLRGLPVEDPFAEQDGKPTAIDQPPSRPATFAVAEAVPAIIATPQERLTKPLGVAERLLSDDSALRASAMHEAIAEAEAKVETPAQTERTTREYGHSPLEDATALVEEAVSASHALKPQVVPVPQPERPRKEVDWGAWAAGAVAGEFPTEGVPVPLRPNPLPDPMPIVTYQEVKTADLQANQEAGVSKRQENLPRTGAAPATRPMAQPAPAQVDRPVVRRPRDTATHAAGTDETATKGKRNRGADKNPSVRILALLSVLGLGIAGYRLLTKAKPDLGEGTPSPMLAANNSSTMQAPQRSNPVANSVPSAPNKSAGADRQQPAQNQATVSAPSVALVGELHDKCFAADAKGKGKAKTVAVACRAALNADPNAPDILVVLARAELDRGRLVEAKALAKRALAIDPQRLEAYVFLGNAEQEAGNADEARAAYKKYLELAPSGPFARELRSILSNL